MNFVGRLLIGAAVLASSMVPATLPAAWFVRGDVNASGAINVTDAIQVFRFLFLGDPAAVSCPDAADLDDDGQVSITDGIYLLGYLFQGGPPPITPNFFAGGPRPKTSIRGCWFDRTTDALDCPSFVPCSAMGVFIVGKRSGNAGSPALLSIQKEAIEAIISSLSEQSQFGIVLIANEITKFPASGPPAEANPAMKEAAIAFVRSTQADHGSCVLSGLMEGLGFAALSNRKEKEIVFFSDGQITCGNDPDEILSRVRERNWGVIIHVIDIGAIVSQQAWMKDLAAQNGGSYVRIVR